MLGLRWGRDWGGNGVLMGLGLRYWGFVGVLMGLGLRYRGFDGVEGLLL